MSLSSGISFLSSEGFRDLRCLYFYVRWWFVGFFLGGVDDFMFLLEVGRV